MPDDASDDDFPPFDPDASIEIPIDGVLDLHTFHPRDVKELLPAYFSECRARGIFEVRVIHGKGTGQLRRYVEAVLARDPQVVSSRAGRVEDGEGGWGATIVTLRAAETDD